MRSSLTPHKSTVGPRIYYPATIFVYFFIFFYLKSCLKQKQSRQISVLFHFISISHKQLIARNAVLQRLQPLASPKLEILPPGPPSKLETYKIMRNAHITSAKHKIPCGWGPGPA